MKSLVREARLKLGLSMDQLGARMKTSPSSVAGLEQQEVAGIAETEAVRRALAAAGMTSESIAVATEPLARAEKKAKRIARSVETTMSLEGQGVPPTVARRVYERALRNERAKL